MGIKNILLVSVGVLGIGLGLMGCSNTDYNEDTEQKNINIENKLSDKEFITKTKLFSDSNSASIYNDFWDIDFSKQKDEDIALKLDGAKGKLKEEKAKINQISNKYKLTKGQKEYIGKLNKLHEEYNKYIGKLEGINKKDTNKNVKLGEVAKLEKEFSSISKLTTEVDILSKGMIDSEDSE